LKSSIKTEVVVVGAGVVGLAVAYKLSCHKQVLLIEKNDKFGQETSSRNSEVIHSGIYYPRESRKTAFCIKGRELLYLFCSEFNIPFKKCGKFVVATSSIEQDYLHRLKAHSDEVQVPNDPISAKRLKSSLPLVQAKEAIYFPESGIVDSHALMARLEQLARAQDTVVAYSHEVKGFQPSQGGWQVLVQNRNGELETILSERVINCAGLPAAELSNQALRTNKYQHRFCRGRYFNLSSKFSMSFKSMVYPTPNKDGLGVHITSDLGGRVRLGPDVDWSSNHSYQNISDLYDCDWDSLRPHFLASARRYLPNLELNDLSPGQIGVRPKLFSDGFPYQDFLIENHQGFIHLLGIESPGLTAALAIAEAVREKI